MNKQTEIRPPTKPDVSECCNRGCENCVYVYYDKALKRWEAKVDKIKKKTGLIR